MSYFDLCQAPAIYQHTCDLTLIATPSLISLTIFITFYKCYTEKLSPISLLQKIYANSIFSCLQPTHPYSSFLLFILVAYGSFIFKPLGSLRFIFSPNSDQVYMYLSVVISAVTTVLYLFTVIFTLNFFAVKSEIIRSQGDPVVSESARPLFVRMVTKRSLVISSIYLFGMLANLVLTGNVQDTFDQGSGLQWSLRAIFYCILATMAVSRFYYIWQVERMIDIQARRKNERERLDFFHEHIRSNLLSSGMMIQWIRRYDKPEKDEIFLRNIEGKCKDVCELSLERFNQLYTAVETRNDVHVPLLTHQREKHLVGSIWLIFTLIDSFCNLIVSLVMTVAVQVTKSTDGEPSVSMGWIIFIFNVLDIVVQSPITFSMMTNLDSFGREQDNNRGESMDRSRSLSRGSDLQYDFEHPENRSMGLGKSYYSGKDGMDNRKLLDSSA